MWYPDGFDFLAYVSSLAKQVIHKWFPCLKNHKREKYMKCTVVSTALGRPRSLGSLPHQVPVCLEEDSQSSSKDSPVFLSVQ